ncbi:MAG TPA: tRNA (adenosine(37)-N6)-dimethylallyltransferase MiaA [Clostridia bacterium]|nr:tRNA (adenosine(37)-N6)-dimethylallyltransferase MiaA [Clostridia bacterium]
MSRLICIAGPTAVGKSDIALQLAKKLNRCIVSADSFAIYKGMDIGTAKPSKTEQAEAKHFMIDVVEPCEEYNAFLYSKAVDEVLKTNPNAIAVGGTGLYFESLLYGLDFPNSDDTQKLRSELWDFCDKFGKEALHKKLAEINPERAEKIHPNNVKSVIRALEILDKKDFTTKKERKPVRDYVLFAMNCDRNLLYERINTRVDKMFELGLVEEVELLSKKYDSRCQAFQAIGYKETLEYLKGEFSLSDIKEQIKRHTRNYAKRQITFIKRLNPIWIDANKGKDDIIAEIESYLR